MSFSSELPCALAETGASTGVLPVVVMALICLALGALLVLAARHAKSRERLARAFGAVVLIGGVLLVSGVSAPAAEASDGANACAEQAPTQSTVPPAPKPVTCAVLPEYLGSDGGRPTVFTEGDTTSMEGFWDTGQSGSLGFGEHFETTVWQLGFGDWVSQVNAAGGTVELRFERFNQFVLAYDFWDLMSTYWWDASVVPGPSVELQAVDADTAAVASGIEIPEAISYVELVQLVRDSYRAEHQVELPDEYLPLLQQQVSSLSGMSGEVVASLPAQAGCAEASVSYPVHGPARQ